jgi:hypothetical protein
VVFLAIFPQLRFLRRLTLTPSCIRLAWDPACRFTPLNATISTSTTHIPCPHGTWMYPSASVPRITLLKPSTAEYSPPSKSTRDRAIDNLVPDVCLFLLQVGCVLDALYHGALPRYNNALAASSPCTFLFHKVSPPFCLHRSLSLLGPFLRYSPTAPSRLQRWLANLLCVLVSGSV